jgi:hypothetical protein
MMLRAGKASGRRQNDLQVPASLGLGIRRDGLEFAIAVLAVLALGVGLPALLFGPLGLGGGGSARLQAGLTYAGVMITGAVTLVGLMAKRQSDKRLVYEKEEQLKQLRLDAAMRAGQLFFPGSTGHAEPAAMASGLLALTRLDHADLAVALLVDLWSVTGQPVLPGDAEPAEIDSDSASRDHVSTETAILVIDAALRSSSSNAQLVAAELLCRNARRLQPGQSLHWPSALEGCWIPSLAQRAKLLIVEAVVTMTLACGSTETALRSAAVRLYGIWRDDPDKRVKGCIGKLISALIPRLEDLHYNDFMQGSQQVMLSELKDAAASADTNPDGYLDQLSTRFAVQLRGWADRASGFYTGPGCLAASEYGPATTRLQPSGKKRAIAAPAQSGSTG